ncbi:general transcription factor iiic polypeptide 3 gtf3c3 [Cystoisospora suis]|uniref:General transcription factor iiic polypeptide 3 gtf3c3 n=1 Tax=Cystoisospora suis TaxID=483139 RepID=A0A2C6L0V7_9APIC|nr:general transcription factor iiic polypeptide 3 gtf3c3 [Cystoisospora suis]
MEGDNNENKRDMTFAEQMREEVKGTRVERGKTRFRRLRRDTSAHAHDGAEDESAQEEDEAEKESPADDHDRQNNGDDKKVRRSVSASVSRGRKRIGPNAAASISQKEPSSSPEGRPQQEEGKASEEVEASQDDDDLASDEEISDGTITSDPPDTDDSDWLLEDNDEELRSESSISESEMEEYFLRDSDEEAEKNGTGGGRLFGGRQRRRKKKRKRAEPFSGKKAERKKKRRKTAATPSEMPPEVKKLMGEATDAYLNENFDEAVKILQEVVRRCPGLHDPFHLLGLIYEEAYGDKRRAVDFYLLAAHLVVPGDPELWRHTGNMSLQLSNIPQAIYCFRRCLRNGTKSRLATAASASAAAVVGARAETGHPGPLDWEVAEEEDDDDQEEDEARGLRGKEEGEDSGWEEEEGQQKRKEDKKEKPTSMEEEVAFALASCYQQTGEHRRAVSLLYALLSFHPRDFLFTRELARSLHRLCRVTEARGVLETAVLPLLPSCVRTEIERAGPSEPAATPTTVLHEDRPADRRGSTEEKPGEATSGSVGTSESGPGIHVGAHGPSESVSCADAFCEPSLDGALHLTLDEPEDGGTSESDERSPGCETGLVEGEERVQKQKSDTDAIYESGGATGLDEVLRKLEAEPEWEGRMVLEPLQLDCINILSELYLHQEYYRRCFFLLRFVTRGWFPVQLPLDLFVKREAAALFVGFRSHAADLAERLLRNAAVCQASTASAPTDSPSIPTATPVEKELSSVPGSRDDTEDSTIGAHPEGGEKEGKGVTRQALPLPVDSGSSQTTAVATIQDTTGSGETQVAGDKDERWKKRQVKGEYGDLFVILADAWAYAGQDDRAQDLYYIVQELPEFSRDTNVALKMAHCLLRLGDASGAAEFLQGWLARSEAAWQHTAGVRDADVRLLLCDVLKRLGRDLEADYTLLTISYKHLREKDKLPRAWTNADRERQLFDLQGLLEALLQRSPHAPISAASTETAPSRLSGCLPSFEEANERRPLVAAPATNSNAEGAYRSGGLLCMASSSRGIFKGGDAVGGWRPHRLPAVHDVVGVSPTAVADRFLALVRECEMDSRRVLRQVCQRRVEIAQDPRVEHFFSKTPGAASAALKEPEPLENNSLLNIGRKGGSQNNRVKDPNKALQHYKIKQDLGLKSIEDFVGLRGYLDFLCNGVELLRRQGRYEVAVSLLEAVLANWRQKRPDGNDAQKRFIKDELEMISLSLSVEGQLVRVALASLRRILQRRMSSRRPGNTTGLLGLYGRLLFSGPLALQAHQALAAAKEKDLLLENRSWAIRQLLHQPHNEALTLIVGHFCMLSSRWRFAVAEYTRAHCLRPDDPLTCLCLGVAYLCLSTSNKVQNKHDIVLRGFALLGQYSQLRQRNGAWRSGDQCLNQSVRTRVLSAESVYNLARAYHHVNLLHLAVPLYMKCLELLDEIEDDLRINERCVQEKGDCSAAMRKPHGFSRSNLPSRKESSSPSDIPTEHSFSPGAHREGCGRQEGGLAGGGGIREVDPSMRFDREQLRRCAAHNLVCVWRAQGARQQACYVAHRYLVWDE